MDGIWRSVWNWLAALAVLRGSRGLLAIAFEKQQKIRKANAVCIGLRFECSVTSPTCRHVRFMTLNPMASSAAVIA